MKKHAWDSRNGRFTTDVDYLYGTPIQPGSVLVQARSAPENHPNSTIFEEITLTVLRERPPVGSFRPAAHLNGGIWRQTGSSTRR